MLGASEKIALLSRQNEALLHLNKMFDTENTELRERCHQLENEMTDLKTSLPIAVPTNSHPPAAHSTSTATASAFGSSVSVSSSSQLSTGDSKATATMSTTATPPSTVTANTVSSTDSTSTSAATATAASSSSRATAAVVLSSQQELEGDISQISRCQQQILFLAKHGEKDLSHSLARYQAEYEEQQAQLQREESLLRDLSHEYELLQNQSQSQQTNASTGATASGATPSSTRQTLERALSIPSLSLGRLASRLSIVASSATTASAVAAATASGATSDSTSIPSQENESSSATEALSAPEIIPVSTLATGTAAAEEATEDRDSAPVTDPVATASVVATSTTAAAAAEEKLTALHQKLSLQESLCVDKRQRLQETKKTLAIYFKETNSLRQIILFLDQRNSSQGDSSGEELQQPRQKRQAPHGETGAEAERGTEGATEGEGEGDELIANSETLWAMKNLNQKNAALAEELRSVKQRFSSVIGRMEGFSLSKFALSMNVLGGAGTTAPVVADTQSSSADQQQQPQGQLQGQGQGQGIGQQEPNRPREMGSETIAMTRDCDPFDDTPVELLFPSPSSPPAAPSSAAADPSASTSDSVLDLSMATSDPLEELPSASDLSEKWTPAFVCAVSQWSRKSRREVVFILRVRNLGTDIRDWSVVKSFPECKALRMKLKPFISGLSLFSSPSLLPHPLSVSVSPSLALTPPLSLSVIGFLSDN
jgi:hypothetical protein